MNQDRIEPWETLDSRETYVSPWVKVSVLRVRLPNGQVIDDYHHVSLPDFVIIFGLTANGKVILVRHYKQGIGKVALFLPAGAIEQGEEPLATARRELLEETGYAASEWHHLGSFVCNSNYGCGRAHVYVAQNARWSARPASGDLEEMQVALMTPEEVVEAVRTQEVVALSSVAAIALAMNPVFNPSDKP